MTKLGVVRGRRNRADRFEALVRPHYRMLYRTAYRWTRSVEEAEDLVQETCVRAYPRLEELEGLDRPAAWLTRVMYRLFVDSTRRHERRFVDALETGAAAELRSDAPGPDEVAERNALSDRLGRAWRHIEREKRVLLTLHDVEGYTLAELSRLTGLKEGTLKSRLHRARVLLGRLLERESASGALQAGSAGARR